MKGFHEFSLDEVTRWSHMGRAGRRAYSAGVDAMLQVLRGDMTKEEFKELMGRDFDSMMKDPQYAKAVKAKMKKEEVEINEAISVKEMGFKKWDGNLPSFRVGRLEGVSVNQLVKVLGRPHYEDSENDQTTMEWGFINSAGLVFTVYDYDNPPKSKSAPHNWSVGGTSEKKNISIQRAFKMMGIPGKMIKEETEITEVFKSGGGVEYYALIVGGKVVAKSTSSKKLRKLADEKYGGYTGYLPKDKSKPKVFVANWPSAKIGDTWKEVKEETEYVNEGFRMQDWERMSKQHKSPEPVRIITKDRKTVDGRLKRFQYYDQGYATKGYYIILHPRKKGGEEVQIDDVDVMNIYWGDDAIRQRVLDVKEGMNEATMKMGDPRLLDAAQKALPAKLANDQKALNKMTRTMWEMWAESDGKIKLPELARLARTKLGMNEETEGGETEGKKLNKPFRTPGEKKKFAVYVKNDNGNVVKVRFGDPNMEIKRDNPDRLKAFRSRHSCDDDVGPKWKARYWSCQMWRADKGVDDILSEAQENEPTDPGLWAQAVAKAKSTFDVYPSAYANAWAAKWYKGQGGGWRKKEKSVKESTDQVVRVLELLEADRHKPGTAWEASTGQSWAGKNKNGERVYYNKKLYPDAEALAKAFAAGKISKEDALAKKREVEGSRGGKITGRENPEIGKAAKKTQEIKPTGKDRQTAKEAGLDGPDSKEEAIGTNPKLEKKVATRMFSLAEVILDREKRKRRGENIGKDPEFEICTVSIPGTNLFCGADLGIPRDNMPQLKTTVIPGSRAAELLAQENEKRKAQAEAKGEKFKPETEFNAEQLFLDHLKSKGVKFSEGESMDSVELKATQNQLVGAKVLGMANTLMRPKELGMNDNEAAKAKKSLTAPLIVSRDGYVLDGHHRWAAVAVADLMMGKGDNPTKISVIKVDMDIEDLLDESNDWGNELGLERKSASQQTSGEDPGKKKTTKEETEKSKEKAMNEEKLDEAVRAIIENAFINRIHEETEEWEEYDLSEMTDSEYNALVESLMESGADFIVEEDGGILVENYEQLNERIKRTIRVRGGKVKRGKTAGRKGYRINKKGRVVKVPAAVLRRKKMKLKRAARRLKGKRRMISRKAKRSKRIGKRFKNRPQNR